MSFLIFAHASSLITRDFPRKIKLATARMAIPRALASARFHVAVSVSRGLKIDHVWLQERKAQPELRLLSQILLYIQDTKLRKLNCHACGSLFGLESAAYENALLTPWGEPLATPRSTRLSCRNASGRARRRWTFCGRACPARRIFRGSSVGAVRRWRARAARLCARTGPRR